MEPCDADTNAKIQLLVDMGFPKGKVEEVS